MERRQAGQGRVGGEQHGVGVPSRSSNDGRAGWMRTKRGKEARARDGERDSPCKEAERRGRVGEAETVASRK